MKIVGIAGSMRQKSYSLQVVKLSMKSLEDKGVEVAIVDLKEFALPFCDGRLEFPDYPDVKRFKELIKSAHGLVVATPEYHGSLSGSLKNALDLLGEEDLKGKTAALIAVMGGASSNNAINTLRVIFRQLHAWVIPEQLIIAHAEEAFADDGSLIDQTLASRLEEMGEHLIKITDKLLR